MKTTKLNELTRRESQAMDVVYANKEVTVAEVQSVLPGEPSYSAVRAVMSRLAEKGLLTYKEKGPKYVYSATTPHQSAGRAALTHLVDTFFGGSTANTFGALLGTSSEPLPDDELDEIERMINEARARKR
jgi:predicted transcriptional regulator|tara:strand:+ start:454 stop:843 length:390 start_codon:yes stop_codon:yes gene_type:complete